MLWPIMHYPEGLPATVTPGRFECRPWGMSLHQGLVLQQDIWIRESMAPVCHTHITWRHSQHAPAFLHPRWGADKQTGRCFNSSALPIAASSTCSPKHRKEGGTSNLYYVSVSLREQGGEGRGWDFLCLYCTLNCWLKGNERDAIFSISRQEWKKTWTLGQLRLISI